MPGLAMNKRLLSFAIRALPWLILALGSLETWIVWSRAQRLEEVARAEDFAARSDEITLAIRARLGANEQILRGVVGLFDASRNVSREEFRRYYGTLGLEEHFPGIQGVGFAQKVDLANRAEHENRLRIEGFPSYRIVPPGERPIYAPIIFLEPFSGRNLKAFGYDMFSHPVRQAAMTMALETGQTAISGKVTLVQENEISPQAGFLIYVPVFAPGRGKPVGDWKQLRGWAYSPLRMNDMMEGLLGERLAALRERIQIEIFDGTDVAVDQLMFSSHPADTASAEAISTTRQLTFGGRQWTVRTRSLPDFDTQYSSGKNRLLALTGTLLTLVLFTFSVAAARHREKLSATLEEAHAANRELFRSRAHLQLIYDTSGVAIFLVDLTGRITHANQSMEEMFGCSREDLIGSEYIAHIHPNERETGRQKMLALLGSNIDRVDLERLYWRKDGSEFWGNLRGQRMLDEYGRSVGLVGVILNVDERRKLQAELEQQAHTDALTGVPNRRYFLELAEQEFTRSQRYARPLSVLMIDVDHFKRVNDSHGHATGDLVLNQLTGVCASRLRQADVIGRMGGEEFAVILPETDVIQARETAERLRVAVEATPIPLPQGLPLQFTISIGVASLDTTTPNLDTLLSRADEALYAAKHQGRNRVCIAQE